MRYCVAAALLDGARDLSTFSDQAVGRQDIRSLIRRIEMEVAERVRADKEFAAIVEVETADGRKLAQEVRVAPGKPARWFSTGQLRGKFSWIAIAPRGCASRAMRYC
jgi:2-methylcitrate dehydratase PrpD